MIGTANAILLAFWWCLAALLVLAVLLPIAAAIVTVGHAAVGTGGSVLLFAASVGWLKFRGSL